MSMVTLLILLMERERIKNTGRNIKTKEESPSSVRHKNLASMVLVRVIAEESIEHYQCDF